MSFFAELKRRNVFKVAAAYIIVGWLIMQAGDVMGPALRLPDWINSALAFFLIMGFPLAMFLAWAYEMTPDGLKKEKDVEPSSSITNMTGQKLNHTIIVLLVVALGYFIWKSQSHQYRNTPETAAAIATQAEPSNPAQTDKKSPDKKSIAVIPFRNRSANKENAEFFSDGVHDELLTNLAKIKELKVISRTSVMTYRDTTKNLRQIGQELGVANILEGGVQRAGDSVRINVQLIDAATDEHLWANVYDRQLSAENVFAIQTEIAKAIASALEATLSPQEQEQLATVPTTNLEAYDNLLIARQLIERSNWQGLWDALSYLNKSIELDPGFVQAHVLLAKTYYNLLATGATTLQEIREPWQMAIQTALSLDDNNASAYAAKAQYLWQTQQQGVEDVFEKARRLEPYNAEIMVMYGEYLRKNFHHDQALPLYQMAKESDPLSIRIQYGLARIHEARGEVSEAFDVYARIRQIDPSSQIGYGPPATLYMLSGDMVQSTNWIFKSLAVDPDDSDLYNWVAMAYIDFDDLVSAGQWLHWIERTKNTNPMTFASLAMLNIYQADVDASMAYTRQAFDKQMPNRWGSDSILVRALLIWALDQAQTGTALAMVRQAHPELFEQIPQVDADNVLQAIDAAHLLQSEKRNDEARILLQVVMAAYAQPYAVTEVWNTTGKAQALALLGETQAALDELRQQVDKGWRFLWRWNTELNPNFEALRKQPEFSDIVEFLRTDMARQREELRVMETAGEIPLPPGDDA